MRPYKALCVDFCLLVFAGEESQMLPALEKEISQEEGVELGNDWRSVIDKQPTRAHPYVPSNKPPIGTAAHRASAPLDEMINTIKQKPFVEDQPKTESARSTYPTNE